MKEAWNAYIKPPYRRIEEWIRTNNKKMGILFFDRYKDPQAVIQDIDDASKYIIEVIPQGND